MWLLGVPGDALGGWRKEEEEQGAQEGSSGLPASHQHITDQQVPTLLSDTSELSYSNHGSWKAATLDGFPRINTCEIHFQVFSTVLLFVFFKNHIFAIILKQAILR